MAMGGFLGYTAALRRLDAGLRAGFVYQYSYMVE